MLLIYILDAFGKEAGNSWFHAAVGNLGFCGIAVFVSFVIKSAYDLTTHDHASFFCSMSDLLNAHV